MLAEAGSAVQLAVAHVQLAVRAAHRLVVRPAAPHAFAAAASLLRHAALAQPAVRVLTRPSRAIVTQESCGRTGVLPEHHMTSSTHHRTYSMHHMTFSTDHMTCSMHHMTCIMQCSSASLSLAPTLHNALLHCALCLSVLCISLYISIQIHSLVLLVIYHCSIPVLYCHWYFTYVSPECHSHMFYKAQHHFKS